MIVRPNRHHHAKTRDKVEPGVPLRTIAGGELSGKPCAQEPRERIDNDEYRDKSAPTQNARNGQEKRAGRRINEIVVAKPPNIDFVASQNVSASFVPSAIVNRVLSAQTAQHRQNRED